MAACCRAKEPFRTGDSNIPRTYEIRMALLADLAIAAELFDAYRQFYGQSPDPALAEAFLRERLAWRDSAIFLAVDADGAGLGFAQLYPSFSSVAARRIWILNDLFVPPASRCRGIGRALLDAARSHALASGARRIVLSTAADNAPARKLYEAYGFRRDEVFVVYKLEV